MIADLLIGLAKANVAAAVAVAAVLVLRGLVQRSFGARATYALWLAPLAAGLAAGFPHQTAVGTTAPVILALASSARRLAPAEVADVFTAWPAVLLALWLAGAALTATVLLRRQAAFLASLGRLQPLNADEPRVLRAERIGIGPAVVGAWRPWIVTPADFEARFPPKERALVLAHERVHLAGGDAAINALACALLCLCWFNPLVHLGVRRLRTDQELACDAAVIGRFPGERRLYAELLLKTQLAAAPLPFGCHWPSAAQHPLKERIVMLKSALPAPAVRAMGVLVAASVSVAAGGAAWAAAPTVTPAKLITQPIWVQKPAAADFARLYPADAVADRLTAHVVVTCRIGDDGRLPECGVGAKDIQVEGRPPSPADQGFGTAALQAALAFQMAPRSRDGVQVAGGTVRIPMIWRAP